MRFKSPQIHTKALVTWHLVPKNTEHPLWKASRVAEEIHVRARSATEARLIAASQPTTVSVTTLPRALTSPWLDHNLASAGGTALHSSAMSMWPG
jgi:hypothetical protein